MYVDIWYDRTSRSWYATLRDANGFEVADSVYGYTMDDAKIGALNEGWGEYEFYKDVERNGFKKRLN